MNPATWLALNPTSVFVAVPIALRVRAKDCAGKSKWTSIWA